MGNVERWGCAGKCDIIGATCAFCFSPLCSCSAPGEDRRAVPRKPVHSRSHHVWHHILSPLLSAVQTPCRAALHVCPSLLSQNSIGSFGSYNNRVQVLFPSEFLNKSFLMLISLNSVLFSDTLLDPHTHDFLCKNHVIGLQDMRIQMVYFGSHLGCGRSCTFAH